MNQNEILDNQQNQQELPSEPTPAPGFPWPTLILLVLGVARLAQGKTYWGGFLLLAALASGGFYWYERNKHNNN